jgi:hypothetical protein
MIVQSLRHAGWPVVFACASAVACSKTPATPSAFVGATLGGLKCPVASATVINAGGMTPGAMPMTVPDQTNGLSITCSVQAGGSGFNISLSAHQAGGQGGDLVITGSNIDANGGTVNTQWVSQASGLEYGQSDCKLTYTYIGQSIPMNQRISSGNIWGHVSCPNAMDLSGSTAGTQTTTADGGVINSICDGEADFLFSNCSE